jgi:hypothetical protein
LIVKGGIMQRTLLVALAALAALFAVANTAGAQAIITNGSGIYLGVDTLGQLNIPDGTGGITLAPNNSYYIGLYYSGIGGDATSPGCLCEGFGVAGNGVSGWADNEYGISNLSSVSFTSSPSTATSIVTLTSLPDLQLTQQFQSSASTALMENIVTITNTGTSTITDVRYNRTMDWDIPPTTFDEYTTVQGWPADNLLYTSNDGFDIPDPMAEPSEMSPFPGENVNFYHAGPYDHGAFFTFAFGDLDPGESIDFSIFYGAAPSEASAYAALGVVGAEVYSYGQPNPAEIAGAAFPIGEPVTFIFGFSGVGGTPVPTVPEPSTILLMGVGLLGLGAVIRRKRS